MCFGTLTGLPLTAETPPTRQQEEDIDVVHVESMIVSCLEVDHVHTEVAFNASLGPYQ